MTFCLRAAISTFLLLAAVAICAPGPSEAQTHGTLERTSPRAPDGAPKVAPIESYDLNLQWRNVGPWHGGRATTAVGVPGNNQVYYMGAAGGGVWKTEDAGESWHNISDKYFTTGSIGDIAVYAGDPNIIYVGTGEAPVRGQMSSYGDGVYKSTDAGKTWTHVGLEKTMQIARIVIHPTNPNLVYVAAQGNRWAPSRDRGIYRSSDGGVTWHRILFSSNIAGACDLQMDPYDPNVLYAAFWDFQRFAWKIRSGGPGSGIWKTTDGGAHWMRLKTGLPKLMGKIRLAVSPANDSRIYAAIENEKTGLFISDDAGMTWHQKVDDNPIFQNRPWYYLSLTADPKSVDTVYLNSNRLSRSTDGGKTFKPLSLHHGDTHSLWINPADPRNMINTDDGGAEITFDWGKTWSPIFNQPTAQFYTVRADDQFPYNLYSGQQDTAALQVASRTFGSTRAGSKWKDIANNESARPSFDPKNPRFVFTPGYLGSLVRTDMETGIAIDVSPWPLSKLGTDAAHMTYRFEWSPPSIWSPFDARTIYFGGNVLFRTTDQGITWDVISPDLTRNDKSKQGRSGLFWHDGAGGEIYDTIYAIAESPLQRGTIWVGTDDGLVQLTRDGGKTWMNVTPKGAPEGWVYTVEPSPHDKATAYVTLSARRSGDLTPHFYETKDYGRTWRDLAKGLPQHQPARVLREDPVRKGLLYAATEYAMWISFDDGVHWQSFQQNLPHVPVSDLLVHDNDLLASTEGRGFWVIDDITTLRQMTQESTTAALTLFRPRDTYRIADGARRQREVTVVPSTQVPRNPPNGVMIRYILGKALAPTDNLRMEILSADGTVVRSYASAVPAKVPDEKEGASQHHGGRATLELPTARGLNQAVWDFRATPIAGVKGDGPMLPSGRYTVRMTLGSTVASQSFNLMPDPRTAADTEETEKERLVLTRQIMEAIASTGALNDELHDVLLQARNLEKEAKKKPSRGRDVALESFIAKLGRLDKRFEPVADPPGIPTKLNVMMAPLAQLDMVKTAVDTGEGPITQGDRLRAKEVEELASQLRSDTDNALKEGIPKVNALISASGMGGAIIPHPGVVPPHVSTEALDHGYGEEDRTG